MSEKLGDGYVLIRGRVLPLDKAIRSAAQRAADIYSKDFEKKVNKSANQQGKAFQRSFARAMASGNYDGFIRQMGGVRNAISRVTAMMDGIEDGGWVPTKRMREYISQWEEHVQQLKRAKAGNLFEFGPDFEDWARGWRKRIQNDIGSVERRNRTIKKLQEQLASDDIEIARAAQKRITEIVEEEARDRAARLRRGDDSFLQRVSQELSEEQRLRFNALQERLRAERVTNTQLGRLALAAARGRIVEIRKLDDAAEKARLEAMRKSYERMGGVLFRGMDLEAEWERLAQRTWGRGGQEFERVYMEYYAPTYDKWDQRQRRLGRSMSRFPEIIGRSFGRGARNDFINFIGSVARGLATLPVAVAKFGLQLGQAALEAVVAFKAVRMAGGNLTTAIGGGLSGALRVAGPLLASFGVGLLAVAFMVPAVIAGITMLAGAITAVAGAIAVALAGSILPLVPAFFALSAILGPIIAAFVHLNDETESVTAAFKPLTDAVKGFKDAMEPIAVELGNTLSRFAPIIENELIPLFARLSEIGNRDFFGRLIDTLTSPEFADIGEQWGTSLEKMAGSMSRAIADMIAGLIAFFTPILPYAERLLENFEDVQQRFLDWATSAEGQNSIADFMDTAWDAATKFWNALTDIGDALGSIFFSATENSGGDFLTWLEDATKGLADFLGSSEGQESMKSFWDDVTEFMKTAKDTLAQFFDAWDAFDTDKARDNFNRILNVIEGILQVGEYAGHFFDWIWEAIEGIDEFIVKLGDLDFDFVPPWFKDIMKKPASEWGKDIEGVAKAIGEWFGGLPGVVGGFFADIGRAIGRGVSGAGRAVGGWFADGWARVRKGFSDAISGIGKWGSDLGRSIGSAITGARDAVGKWFSDGWDSVTKGFSDAVSATGRFVDDVVDWFKGLPSRVGDFLYNLPTLIVDIIGQAVYNVAEALNDAAWAVRDWVVGLYTTVSEWLPVAWAAVVEWFTNIYNSIVEWVTNAFLATVEWFGQLPERMAEWFSSAYNSTVEWFTNIYNTVTQWVSDTFNSVVEWFSQLPGAVGEWLSSTWDNVSTWFVNMFNTAVQWTTDLYNDVVAWFASLPGKVGEWLSGLWDEVSSFFQKNYDTATEKTQNLFDKVVDWFSQLPGKVWGFLWDTWTNIVEFFTDMYNSAVEWTTDLVEDVAQWFKDLPGKIKEAIGDLWEKIAGPFIRAYEKAQDWWDDITGIFNSAEAKGMNMTLPRVPRTASGGVFSGAQTRIIAEAGPEAVVPLNRPLSQVDPSVRAISALLQGKGGGLSGLGSGGGKSVLVQPGAIVVQSNATDAIQLAEGILDRFTARTLR